MATEGGPLAKILRAVSLAIEDAILNHEARCHSDLQTEQADCPGHTAETSESNGVHIVQAITATGITALPIAEKAMAEIQAILEQYGPN